MTAIKQAAQDFQSLDVNDPSKCDAFFARFGVGNTLEMPYLTLERITYYEELLDHLQNQDRSKFETMHKGVPYYILSWLAADMRNYDRALFYMDAAISEDIKKDPVNWKNNPAAKFLVLDKTVPQIAQRSMDHTIYQVEKELVRFSNSTGKSLTLDSFREYFIHPLLEDRSNRTIVSALFIFILERIEREFELMIRSSEGGTISLVLTHLFKGAVLWESLLKLHYPIKTIGGANSDSDFQRDFPIVLSTSASTLADVLVTAQSNQNTLQTAFNTAAQIRNTSGHKITWQDEFSNRGNYVLLFELVTNAILFFIHKKYLEGKPPLTTPTGTSLLVPLQNYGTAYHSESVAANTTKP